MKHPVKITHEIIDLAGKLDWCTQRRTVEEVEQVIKDLRNKINQLQHFLNTYEEDT